MNVWNPEVLRTGRMAWLLWLVAVAGHAQSGDATATEPVFYEAADASTLALYGSGDHGDTDSLAAVLGSVWRDAPAVREARAQLAATGFEVSGARTGYLPYLQVLAAQGDRDRTEATASVIQPLWDGGLTGAQVDEAKALQRRAQAQLQSVQLRTGQDAAEAYFDIALAEELDGWWKGYIGELELLQGLVERRAAQGVAAEADIDLARVRLQQAQAGLALNEGRQLAARSALAALLSRRLGPAGWPPPQSVVAPADIAERLTAGVPLEHPARLAAVFELQTAEAQLRSARASLWPKLSLQYVQQLEQQRGDLTPENATQLVLQYQTDNGLRAFRGGQAQAQRVEAARESVIQAEREIADRVASAQALRDSAARQFQAQAKAAQSSRLLVDSYLRQFKVGRKTWLEVLNARREAHETTLQAVGAKRDYWVANTRLALQGLRWSVLSPDTAGVYETEAHVDH